MPGVSGCTTWLLVVAGIGACSPQVEETPLLDRSVFFGATEAAGGVLLPDGRYLAESNAILGYLAADSDLAGRDRYTRAEILQWMFFEQYSHEPNIATSRFIVQYLGSPPDRQAALEEKRIAGYKALDVMEAELKSKEFFVDDKYSLADIALYAYTHVASDGGFDLKEYPGIRAWLERVEGTPAYVPMRVK